MARIVLGSYMVRYPLGGMMSWALQYLVGFARLGHEVYFVEKGCYPQSCFDPRRSEMTDDCRYGVRVVRECEQQVLECKVGVPPGHRLARRNVKDGFNRCREHGYRLLLQASSTMARSGNPASRASWPTLSALVSAISNGYTPAMPRPLT